MAGLLFAGWALLWCAALLVPVHLQIRTVVAEEVLTTAEVRWLILRRRLDVNVSARAQAALQGLLTRAVERQPGATTLDKSRIRFWQRWLRRRWRSALAGWRYLAPRLRVQRLQLLAEVGTGDAMATALACGGVWALFSEVIGAAASANVGLRGDAVQVVVQPQFGAPGVRGLADLRVAVRPLHLLCAGWHALGPVLAAQRRRRDEARRRKRPAAG